MGEVRGKYGKRSTIKCLHRASFFGRAVHRKCRAAISGTPASKPAKKLLVGLLARLVGNAAAGLAGALAGSLALAAAAVQQALSHVAGLESLDVLHKTVTPLYILELLLLYTEIRGLSIGAEGKQQTAGGPSEPLRPASRPAPLMGSLFAG